MGLAQLFQSLFVPPARLPQLFQFRVGPAGIKLRHGMLQGLQFLIASDTSHNVQHLQLRFVEYSPFHNQMDFNWIIRQKYKYLSESCLFFPLHKSKPRLPFWETGLLLFALCNYVVIKTLPFQVRRLSCGCTPPIFRTASGWHCAVR